jgi:flagellin-like protein
MNKKMEVNQMKGITPIISIIVLLLITISLAGAAYVFLGGYMTGLTGRTLQVQNPGSCIAGGTAFITVTNMGSLPVNSSSCSVNGPVAECGDITVVREDGGNLGPAADFGKTSLAPSTPSQLDSTNFQDPGCGASTICSYSFSTPGMSAPVRSDVRCA